MNVRAALALALVVASPAVTHFGGLYTGVVTLAAGAVLAVWSRK